MKTGKIKIKMSTKFPYRGKILIIETLAFYFRHVLLVYNPLKIWFEMYQIVFCKFSEEPKISFGYSIKNKKTRIRRFFSFKTQKKKLVNTFWSKFFTVRQWWYVMSKRPFDYTKHGRRRYTLHKLLHSRKSTKSLRLHHITHCFMLILGRFTSEAGALYV